MKQIIADGRAEFRFIDALATRSAEMDRDITATVREIIEAVRIEKDQAVRRYSLTFDGTVPEVFEIPKEVMEQAYHDAEPSFVSALQNASANIKDYHMRQIEEEFTVQRSSGSWLKQRILGLDKVGVYVPGGTASYPSTVLMNVIPAKLAKVKEVIMVTPRAGQDVLAAAAIAGVDRIFLAGGAQAIAALAFGTESFPRVDKIVGPGNAYVATAKKLLYGVVDIDMIAGPSEILVIADETANEAFVAADLLSQAEHDKMAASLLLTTSKELADGIEAEIERQIVTLDRKDIITSSLRDYGAVILCRSREEMVVISNAIAPEHLEIMTHQPEEILEQITNAGSVFLGDYSPEPLGDYYAGTNHVLPTSGTARFSSPLGVYSFTKKMSCTYYSKESLRQAASDILIIAAKEGLSAHAGAIRQRFSRKEREE